MPALQLEFFQEDCAALQNHQRNRCEDNENFKKRKQAKCKNDIKLSTQLNFENS